jgi:hypothetical protein
VVKLPLLLALSLAPAAVLADWRNEPVYAQFSAPFSAGEPIEGSATVRANFDGAKLLSKCEVIVSSGDPVADKHACVTVPTFGATGVVEGVTKVWHVPEFSGIYIGPVPTSAPGRWSIVSDIPRDLFKESSSGTIMMRVEIDEVGITTRCDVFLPSRSAAINIAVQRNFCKRAKFRPATLDGKPIASRVLMAIRYAQPLG